MRSEQLKTTPFVTNEQGRGRSGAIAAASRARAEHRKRGPKIGGSMGIKIGICLGVLAIVAAVQLLFHPFDGRIVETGAGSDSGSGTDETLGRLRFVSSHDAASVFSGSQRWAAPVADVASCRTGENNVMELAVLAGDIVSCPASGEVREIGSDHAMGAFLRIAHGNGLESIYYNMDTILVELGQPVLALDTLGTVGESGILYVSVLQSGEEQPPEDYLSVRMSS